MREIDRWAIEERGVPSLELMETAGAALASAVTELSPQGPVRVICGKGNNGGDGLVAARLLAETGFEVEALLLWPGEEMQGDAAVNLERFASVETVDAGSLPHRLEGSGAVVDAIFGTGFSGAARPPAAGAIAAINDCDAPVIAADIASGVDASSGEIEGAAISAAVTVTFHAAKVGHLIAPGKHAGGELRIAPIGIPDGAPAEPAAGVIDPRVLRLTPRRGSDSNKFTSGQVVLAGGSRGLTGSICMAAEAAIRSGAGYATVAVPDELESIFEQKLTEVMSVGCTSEDGRLVAASAESVVAAFERAAAGVLGPGLGRHPSAAGMAREIAGAIDAPLVIDADGLNAFSGDLGRIAARSRPTVLTPHAGELGRLLERSSEEISGRRLDSAREAAVAAARRRRAQGGRHDRHRWRESRGERDLGSRAGDRGNR